MSSRTKHAILAIADGSGDKPPKAVSDLRALPSDSVVQREKSLIQRIAEARPKGVIRGNIDTIKTPGKLIALSAQLVREHLGIAVIIPLQEMPHT
jgi:hypothetical protein